MAAPPAAQTSGEDTPSEHTSNERTPSERAIDLFETLPPYAPGVGRYSRADRYRDFRKVLVEGSASAAQARCVLWQIFEETRLFHTPISGDDTHLTYARIGKQEIGRWLLTVMTETPESDAAAPAQTQNTDDNRS